MHLSMIGLILQHYYFTSSRIVKLSKGDFYSFHVIPLNKTICNYFVNWLTVHTYTVKAVTDNASL